MINNKKGKLFAENTEYIKLRYLIILAKFIFIRN